MRNAWQIVSRQMRGSCLEADETKCPICNCEMYFSHLETWDDYAARYSARYKGKKPSTWHSDIHGVIATTDHLMPKSRGGSDSVKNLIVMCGSCNMDKGDRSPSQWIKSRAGRGLKLTKAAIKTLHDAEFASQKQYSKQRKRDHPGRQWVVVEFAKGGKQYTYHNDGDALEPGDPAVADTADGPVSVTITACRQSAPHFKTKPIRKRELND